MKTLIRKLRSSLSLKILLVFILTGALLFAAIRLAFIVSVKEDNEQARKAQLPHYIEYLKHEIGTPPNIKKATQISEDDGVMIYIEGPNLKWAASGDFLGFTKTRFKKSQWPDVWMAEISKTPSSIFDMAEQSRIVKIKHGNYTIYFDAVDLLNPISSSYLDFAIFGLALIILFFSYQMVRRIIRPLSDIKQGAMQLAHGDLTYRFKNIRHDELGELAQTMNYLADQINKMLAAKRHLLLAISHELRSPLTRSKIALEFLDDSKAKASLTDDIDIMQKLISDLLEAERLELPHSELQLKLVSLANLINEVLADFFQPYRSIIIVTMPPNTINITVDTARFKFLLKNLLDNALRHSPEHAHIELTVTSSPYNITINVIDYGEGIAPEHLPHLTQPFYRADAARQRETGGYGLGLYLCQLIVDAHKGTLSFASEVGKGTRVQIKLPTSDVAFDYNLT